MEAERTRQIGKHSVNMTYWFLYCGGGFIENVADHSRISGLQYVSG